MGIMPYSLPDKGGIVDLIGHVGNPTVVGLVNIQNHKNIFPAPRPPVYKGLSDSPTFAGHHQVKKCIQSCQLTTTLA